MTRLEKGEPFPVIEASYVGGGTLRIPEELEGDPNVVLLYRGHW